MAMVDDCRYCHALLPLLFSSIFFLIHLFRCVYFTYTYTSCTLYVILTIHSLFVCPASQSVHLSICLFVYLFICLFVYFSIFLFVPVHYASLWLAFFSLCLHVRFCSFMWFSYEAFLTLLKCNRCTVYNVAIPSFNKIFHQCFGYVRQYFSNYYYSILFSIINSHKKIPSHER